jgi:hypothetical protein
MNSDVPMQLWQNILNAFNNNRPHINDKPKLFCFFTECREDFPDPILNYFVEKQHLNADTLALTLFDFVMDFPKQEALVKHLYKSTLYKSMTKPKSKYAYTDFISAPSHIDQNKLSYLSLFTLQRRNAEQQGNYSQAVSFLNSELCVLLALLKIPVDEKKGGDTKKRIQDSLRKYKGTSGTILNKIAEKRNTLDVSHNKNTFPDVNSQERTIDENEYTKLKGKVQKALETLIKKHKIKAITSNSRHPLFIQTCIKALTKLRWNRVTM